MDETALITAVPKQLWIGGGWRDGLGSRIFEVEDPATGRPMANVADASSTDATAALDAACAAQDTWAATAPRERGEILRRAFEAMIERTDDLALLMTLEMGKPLADSRAEVAYAAEFFRWFSEEAVRIDGNYTVAPSGRGRIIVMRRPIGPCLLITPWNFPLAMGTRKIGAAVAAGCTMVLKPAEQTPLSAIALAQILDGAGLPPGVLNVVPTSDPAPVASVLMHDPRLRKLSFTGSTEVGRSLIAASAENVLRVSMELGGNAPFIVFDDADIGTAVEQAVLAKMRNMGEACTAANRFYVSEPITDDFAAALGERLQKMKVGRGTDEGVEVGPLVDAPSREKVTALVGDAIGAGARAITGGRRIEGPGYFFEPTVLAGVPRSARLVHEEIFGPVAPVASFETEEEAIAAANATSYGLIAYVFTRDLERAFRVAERLQVGMVGLNRGIISDPAAPFGGVKHSGFGREGGREGIEEYLDLKYVAMNL